MSEFAFDVFLSHSSKDKPVVREIAKRLRSDGLRVWFDEWILKPGDHVQAKIEEGLEQSRVLVFCMSANAFGSDWARLESYTFRFRDPLNKELRFIPLRLDEAPVTGSLAQFLYIKWGATDREQEYPKLLEACRSPVTPSTAAAAEQVAEKTIQLDYKGVIIDACAFSSDGKRALIAAKETVRLWDFEAGRCLHVLQGHKDQVRSADQRHALSGSDDRTVRLWDLNTGRCALILEGHAGFVLSVAWSSDQRYALSGSMDKTVRLWDLEAGRCLRVFEGHTDSVRSVALSADQRYAISASSDKTVRLWEVETGRCLRVFGGHTDTIYCVFWSADQRRALSGSQDKTVRLWDVETGRCLRVFEGHTDRVRDVGWSADQRRAFSCDQRGGIRVWDLSEFVTDASSPRFTAPGLPLALDQIQYTNAKVLLVGDSSAGKTGLSMRLAWNEWKPSDSTVGAWATQMKLPVSSDDGVEREIWLWDFGGQADQRLIHQLYMEDTALAALVFDGQKEDLFETLGQWDRDLTRASRKPFTKVLAAGRVDAGGLRVSRSQLETFAKERGFDRFLETSAKVNLGCDELKEAILAGIRWADIPWRSSPVLFKRLKEEIIQFKDEGRVLMRFNELRDSLRLQMAEFKDEELKAVVGLLAGPGVVWELEFGSWVLLQPERINAYAQAVIQTLREDEDERGCLSEERVLRGDLSYHSSMQRLNS
jgi:small GTP-binding protein